MARHIVPMSLREPQDKKRKSIYNKVVEHPGEKPGSIARLPA
jgi:hypothetical protein